MIGLTNNGSYLYNYTYGGDYYYHESRLLLWNLFDNSIYDCYDLLNTDQGDIQIPENKQPASINDERFQPKKENRYFISIVCQ
jgi:hypothetical protein